MHVVFPLRLDPRLKLESERIVRKHGMSLNQYVKACLIDANSQEQTIESLRAYVAEHDVRSARKRVEAFVDKDFKGSEPAEEIETIVKRARRRRTQNV